MNAKTMLVLASLIGAASVAIGAFGAHALPGFLQKRGLEQESVTRREDNLETGVRYQMYHALALFGIGLLLTQFDSPAARFAAVAFVIGILLFSGCLYGYVLTGNKVLVMLVPLGGTAFIVGWLALAVGIWRARFP